MKIITPRHIIIIIWIIKCAQLSLQVNNDLIIDEEIESGEIYKIPDRTFLAIDEVKHIGLASPKQRS